VWINEGGARTRRKRARRGKRLGKKTEIKRKQGLIGAGNNTTQRKIQALREELRRARKTDKLEERTKT